MSLTRSWQKYLRSRAVSGPWRLEGDVTGPFRGAVVIPALAESDSLFATLESLSANPPESLSRWLVVVVVNHSARADEAQQKDNLRTLELLRNKAGASVLRQAWVDAASPGLELPAKGGGVGLARKIGFDLALAGLEPDGRSLLVALDADTLVDPSYLPAIEDHFARSSSGAAVLPFSHQGAESPEIQRAIDLYELYLRSYPLGLKLAGSPYAYPTVGSAMACRAEAYVRSGGMNRRAAGEDFYFLQQLAKSGSVAQLSGTVVRPSPRVSARTPFGTGPSMARLSAGETDVVTFYAPECFDVLGGWLKLVCGNLDKEGETLLAEAACLDKSLSVFIEENHFLQAWEQLRRHGQENRVSLAAFHGWFDALKTFRLIRYLACEAFPSASAEQTVAALLQTAGLPSGGSVADLNRQLLDFWGGRIRKGVV